MSDRIELNQLRREHEAEQALQRRLIWAHGSQRAAAIVAGVDKQAKDDLEKWKGLGQ